MTTETCAHTGRLHRWVQIGKITRHFNGRVIDWWQCRGCGRFDARDEQ